MSLPSSAVCVGVGTGMRNFLLNIFEGGKDFLQSC